MTRHEAAELLRMKDDVLVLTHLRPDGDTIGCAAALCHALRRLGKTAWMYDNKGITPKYARFAAPYIAPAGFRHAFLVSVDLADVTLLPDTALGPVDLCIDHHPTNTFYAKETCVEADKASCGEILLEIIKELCGSIDKEEADLLYMAVSTDTGCFVYGNATANTHRAAAEAAEAGADIAGLNKYLFRTARRQRILLEGYACSGLRSYRDNKINIITIPLEMMERAGATENDCDDIASLPGRTEGNQMSFVIRELTPGHCKISARCVRAYDVAAICARYGGGGHRMAAGCEIDASPEECAALMLAAAEEVVV